MSDIQIGDLFNHTWPTYQKCNPLMVININSRHNYKRFTLAPLNDVEFGLNFDFVNELPDWLVPFKPEVDDPEPKTKVIEITHTIRIEIIS